MGTDYWKLIAKKLSGELTSDEEKELSRWLKSDVQNNILFKEAEKIWQTSVSLKKDYSPDVENAWAKFRAKIEKYEIVKFQPNKFSWLKVAAVIICIVSLSFVVRYFLKDGKPETEILLVEVISRDSVKVFYLPDSTKISLNKNSKFFFPERFIDSIRLVSLIGEAFFEVRPDSSAPFVVEAGKTETRVLGTTFNIRAYEDEQNVKVTVITGKVRFTPKDSLESGNPLELKAEDQVTYNKKEGTLKKEKVTGKKLSWWLNIENEANELLKKARNQLKKYK